MNRRGFLSLLAGVAAGAVLDPERALWVPGKKVISIPQEAVLYRGDVFTIAGVYARNPTGLIAECVLPDGRIFKPLQHFVVTDDVYSLDAPVPMSPRPRIDGFKSLPARRVRRLGAS